MEIGDTTISAPSILFSRRSTMLSRLCSALSLAVLVVAPSTTSAQSDNEFAGYVGLTFTPVGAFAPVLSPRAATSVNRVGVQLRTSSYSFDDGDDRTVNVGVGAVITRGRIRTTLELGYVGNTGCGECRLYMVGADVQVPMLQLPASGRGLTVSLNPAIGFGAPSDGDGSVYALGLSVPVAADLNSSGSLTVAPFVSPGYGFGSVNHDGGTDSSPRPMIAGGLLIGSRRSSTAMTLGVRKVFLEGAPMIYAAGFAITR